MLSDRRVHAGPDELQASDERDGGDDEFQFLCWDFFGEHAADDDAGDSAGEKLQQHWSADRAERPVDGAADGGEDESEDDVGADDLRGSHFGIVEQENGAERAGAG